MVYMQRISRGMKISFFGRSQKVVMGGEASSPCDVLSGVPQGSFFSPVLFIYE